MAAPESSGYLDLDFFKFGMKKLGGEKLGFVAQICHKGRVVRISQRFFVKVAKNNFRPTRFFRKWKLFFSKTPGKPKKTHQKKHGPIDETKTNTSKETWTN